MDLESLFSEDSTGWRKKFDDLSVEFEAYKKAMGSSARSSPSPSRGAAGGGGGGAAGLRYLLPEVDQEVVLSLRTQISELQDKVRNRARGRSGDWPLFNFRSPSSLLS